MKTSTELRRLEKSARALLLRVGTLCERYDSARTSSALGHLSEARKDLQAAATVRKAQGD